MHAESGSVARLNSLATTLIDSVKGYRNAAANDYLGGFRDLFHAHAAERKRVLEELRSTIRALGRDPQAGTPSLLGGAHRRWLDFKSELLGHDIKAILGQVEWGEKFLKEKFEAALDDAALTGDARLAVQKAYQSVSKAHDEILEAIQNVK